MREITMSFVSGFSSRLWQTSTNISTVPITPKQNSPPTSHHWQKIIWYIMLDSQVPLTLRKGKVKPWRMSGELIISSSGPLLIIRGLFWMTDIQIYTLLLFQATCITRRDPQHHNHGIRLFPVPNSYGGECAEAPHKIHLPLQGGWRHPRSHIQPPPQNVHAIRIRGSNTQAHHDYVVICPGRGTSAKVQSLHFPGPVSTVTLQ